MSVKGLSPFIILLSILSSCKRGEEAAPIELRSFKESKKMTSPPSFVEVGKLVKPKGSAPDVIPKKVTVQKGDTVYKISKKYNVPIRGIIELNKLRPPFALRVNRELQLPTPSFIEVNKGDTLYSLSRKYQVTMTSLLHKNNLKPDTILKEGMILELPSKIEMPKKEKNIKKKIQKQKKFIKSDKKTKEAARIIPPSRAKEKFLTPLKGKIIKSFGPSYGGLRNDGINIKAEKGTPVLAAENGIVVYTGDDIESYGKLVLIKHAQGWVSAYAHLDEIDVTREEKVSRGQVIGSVGQTGNTSEPQLHFQLRHHRKIHNPLKYIEE